MASTPIHQGTSKLTGFIGAEVHGADLSAPLDSETAAWLDTALAEHHVLVIRDQHLDIDQQKALTGVFGTLARLPYVQPMHGEDDVVAVLKEADEVDTGVFGGDWHSDFSFLENPPAGSVLNAIDIPPYGGDTLWASQAAAYQALPGELRVFVDRHAAIHVGKPYGVQHAPTENLANGSIRMRRNDPAADREIVHPSVITEPGSGERALFLNPIYTTRFENMTQSDSTPYLDAIYRHATLPDFGYRHRWRCGDIVIWNNRTTLHYATNDYDGHRRLLYRTTFQRDIPS